MSQHIIRPFGEPSFAKGSRELNPLPQPGNRLDGRHGELDFALYPSTRQVTTIILGGSTSTDDITTLTVTPDLMATGAPWPDDLGAVTISFKTVGTETLAAVAAGLEAAAAASTLIPTPGDFDDYTRIRDIVLVAAAGDDLALTARLPGASFSYTLTSTGSVIEASVTTGIADEPIRLGTVIAQTAVNPNGSRECANVTPGATVLGIAMDSNFVDTSEPGDKHKTYSRKAEVLYDAWGPCTGYAEKGCAVDAQAYHRTTVTAPEIIGALTDTATTDTPQIVTTTPTVLNETYYSARLRVLDFFTGELVAEGFINMTSDIDATDIEIVTGLTASLVADAPAVDALVTQSGTDTLILQPDAGYTIEVVHTGTGLLTPVITQAALSDHDIYVGAKFLQTTAAAGIAALVIAHSAGE